MPNIHHCPICEHNIFKPSCMKKGHMWRCDKHKLWVRRDWKCVSCENEAEAAARNLRIKKQREAEKKKSREEERGERRKDDGRSNASRARSGTTNGAANATKHSSTNGGSAKRRA
jgi:hypothetical protein